jgi:hypothetical protein
MSVEIETPTLGLGSTVLLVACEMSPYSHSTRGCVSLGASLLVVTRFILFMDPAIKSEYFT